MIFTSGLLAGNMTGCGGDAAPNGQYEVAWNVERVLHPGSGSCEDLQVDHVVVSIVDMATNDTVTETAPCADGKLLTEPLPLGSHKIDLQAFGAAGDRADVSVNSSGSTHGELTKGGQTVTVPTQRLVILDPISSLHPTWNVTYQGQPSSCAQLQPRGVAVVVKADGQAPTTDIWYCDELNANIPLPLAKFEAYAEMLGPSDAVVATSPSAKIGATRGQVDLVFQLDVQ